MKRNMSAFAFVGILCAWILLSFSERQISADSCNLALVPQSTCTANDTGSCPSDCRGQGDVADGTDFSGIEVHTTASVENGGIDGGIDTKNCHRRKNCGQATWQDEKCLNPWSIWHCDPFAGSTCTTYVITYGNWVVSPSADVDPCP